MFSSLYTYPKNHKDNEGAVFKPCSSYGYLYCVIFCIIYAIPIYLIMKFFKSSPILLIVVFFVPGCKELFNLAVYPTIVYVLRNENVLIKYAWKKVVIPYSEIIKIETKNLSVEGKQSGNLFFVFYPGYSLGNLKYADEGEIFAVSTRMKKEVTIIYTARGKKYGVTPADRELFLQMINNVKSKW